MLNAAVTLILLLGGLALAGDTAVTTQGINPVQHSEGRTGDTTTNATKPPNPVQHSE